MRTEDRHVVAVCSNLLMEGKKRGRARRVEEKPASVRRPRSSPLDRGRGRFTIQPGRRGSLKLLRWDISSSPKVI